MKHDFTLLLAIVTFIAFEIRGVAQESDSPSNAFSTTQIGMYAVGTSEMFKDISYSPLKYLPETKGIGLYFSRLSKSHYLASDLQYRTGLARQPEFSEFSSDYLTTHLRFKYLWRVNNFTRGKFGLFLGSQYQFQFMLTDWMNLEAFTFMVSHSLDLSGQLFYSINDAHSFSLSLDVPTIHLLIRPPYNSHNERLIQDFENNRWGSLLTNGDVGTLNKYIEYDINLSYTWRLNKRWLLDLRYENSYIETKERNSIILIQHSFRLGLNLNL